jgi:DNA-directed RNA polymerase specialized sigma24 family protein
MVEVMGRYLNPSDQGERLRELLEIAPTGSQAAVPRTPKRVFRRLEPNKVAELVRGYVDGRRVDDLASEFQINRSTVIGHLDRAGVARRWKKLHPADVQEAKHLYGSGLSLAKVAGHFGVHASTVHSALRKAAVPMRDIQGRER